MKITRWPCARGYAVFPRSVMQNHAQSDKWGCASAFRMRNRCRLAACTGFIQVKMVYTGVHRHVIHVPLEMRSNVKIKVFHKIGHHMTSVTLHVYFLSWMLSILCIEVFHGHHFVAVEKAGLKWMSHIYLHIHKERSCLKFSLLWGTINVYQGLPQYAAFYRDRLILLQTQLQ